MNTASVFNDLSPPTYAENPAGLWASIEKFEFDLPGVELPFSTRLARENDWSTDFSHRVIGEYRRFLFLTATADHTVSPSDQVDQAWHLHMTYTHSYWHDLCEGVLGWPLHHGPTNGGVEEQETYLNLYADTLATYERTFGDKPPVDIWPDAYRRFSDAHQMVRLNRRHHWIIKKPSWWGTSSSLGFSSSSSDFRLWGTGCGGFSGCGGGGCGGGCGG